MNKFCFNKSITRDQEDQGDAVLMHQKGKI